MNTFNPVMNDTSYRSVSMENPILLHQQSSRGLRPSMQCPYMRVFDEKFGQQSRFTDDDGVLPTRSTPSSSIKGISLSSRAHLANSLPVSLVLFSLPEVIFKTF